ncbi:Abscisic acid-insensitive 5-like protein [Thalictrum thalictroides]|uniref:Abscisic acid-insensitive 5-like protein n=1 Tax=Thalictrum thalictroides TaxID=46969 RepID=A0A7J6VRV9_THATH|nr:Abscisic acid-insensitive 5-like protein [Thalictrum thalictroides]
MGSQMNFRNMGDMSQQADGSGRPPGNLARQTSIYSLTFEEFQNSMGGFGKDFGSMNMDEFLKNVWTAEETQVMGSTLGVAEGGVPLGGNLQRQGSLTLPRTLSQKTVDEVWRDLFKENGGVGKDGNLNGVANMPQRQQTMGEMTLEEFLVRAGVVREEAQAAAQQNNGGFYNELLPNNNNPGLSLGFGQPTQNNGIMGNLIAGANNTNIASNQSPNLAISINGITSPGTRSVMMGMSNPTMNGNLVQGGGLQAGLMGTAGLGAGAVTVASGSPANQLSDGLGMSAGDMSSLSPVPYAFNGGLRGRRSGGTVEKVVERRQRRMIKNRESAARSRARKQAYTMELEAELAKLREQNEELQKKQAEIMEMQKLKVLEVINQQRGPKKQCLRRTQTGPCLLFSVGD